MTTHKQYDAIIIGSGQAGNPLAHKLADCGWTVALIERHHLGGSCINYGCTPTKTMLASARVAHVARRSVDFGVETGDVTVDLPAIVARKNRIVHNMRSGQEERVAERPSLDLYRGTGRFTGPHTVTVNDVDLRSEHIFINTGARPRQPDIPGLEDVDALTNHSILDLEQLPEHLLVLGGSYIGLEFGQMFRRFGSRVTVIERGDQIAPREDEDVAQTLQEALEEEGIQFHLGAEVNSVSAAGEGVTVATKQDGAADEIAGTHLLLAVGRVPNTDALNLQAPGVKTDERGYVVVNERLETTAPGVWALGDVKGGPAFTHISFDDHFIVYKNLVEDAQPPRTIKNRIVPYALFTDPELGRVGMTEKEARAAGYNLKVGSIPMAWVARARERGETAGLMKIVIDADTDRILGAAILGSEGGELVQTLKALMMADAPWTLFKDAVFIHPTLNEGFFTLMDSVEAVDTDAGDVP
ncbi:MAG TPA: mercuric reductase [Candidatus Sulfomarinibacteraceae bacterium]|nr:mercuric reductase [Candidatus Sulfomarinibacteraceae bacterium]